MNAAERHAVRAHGEGPRTFVLVHGLGCDQRIWSSLVPRLAVDHRVLTFDLAGVGAARPADPRRHGTLDGYAEDLLEVVASVEGEPPVVIAHSLGAQIAVCAAALRPSFAAGMALLLMSPRFLDDPPYRGGFSEQDLAQLLDTMDRNFLAWGRSFGPLVAPDGADTMTAALTSSDPKTTRHLTELAFRTDLRSTLPRVTIPTLSVQSHADPVVPRDAGALVARLIPGASERLLDVPGHCPHVSHADRVESVLRAWFSSRV